MSRNYFKTGSRRALFGGIALLAYISSLLLYFFVKLGLIAGIERGVMIPQIRFVALSLHNGDIGRALRHTSGYLILSRACFYIITSPFCRQTVALLADPIQSRVCFAIMISPFGCSFFVDI